MPTYEYICMQCKRRVEAVQSFSDEPLRECPHCGGPLRRVFHPVGIVLKGSGFYSTDNRESRKSAASETKKEAASESSKDSKESKDTKTTTPSSSESTSKSSSKKDGGSSKSS
jgi:putative FmdB family regulatory protein